MKITILASYATLAGGTRVLAEYANRLSARGHDVTVVSLPPKQPTTKARLRALVKERKWLPTRTHGASHFDNGQFDWRILDEHRDIEARDVPDGDVVISSWWMTAECMHRLPKSKGEQVHFVQHHELWEPQHFDRVKAVYAHPSHKITISAWLKETLERDYGHSNVPIVHNAANHDTFDAPPRERNATFTIGLMYSKTKFKGLEVSIAALNQAMPEIGDCRLVSFGTSTPEAPTELPEGSEFHLKPPQNKIAEIYRSCDVWLCGSHAEGFHLPPQEAMACRCPVVSTRVGGPMDIVEDGVNGFVVDTGDSKGLADRLVQVASLDADAWRAMSGGAYATGHGWTWENATDAFERELEKAVAVSV